MATPPSVPLSSRSIVRGTTAIFETSFLEIDGTPLVPENSQLYPAVSVTDTDGIVIGTGVAVPVNNEGRWRFSILIPLDATVSTSDNPWRIDWLMVTTSGRSAQLSQNFAVIDQLALDPTDRAYTQLVMLGQSARLMVKFSREQSDVKLVVTDSGGCSLDLSSSIQYAPYEGWYVYYVDTQPWAVPGVYLSTWTSRQNLMAPTQTVVQQIRVPEPAFWFLQPSLRMIIDKSQKKLGHVQAYSDSDIYEYLLRGVDWINSTNPVSHWNLTTAYNASPLTSFLLYAAAWHALNAQFLAAVDLQFSFSGQTVTLDQDQQAGLESALSRLSEYITTNLPPAKANMLRQSHVGVSAGRPISWRHGPYVQKVGTWANSNAQNNLGFLVPLAQFGFIV